MNKVLFALLASCVLLRADFEAGLRAFSADDYEKARSEFTPEAEQGSARAQNALAFLYEHGLGVTKDAETAAGWYRKSAEQEFGPGEYNYGLMCWHGTGVAQSDEEAVKWLQAAARDGVYLAEFDLGNLIYREGSGDSAQALAWWRKAADHGVPAAAYNLAYLYAEGPNIAHDDQEAARWFRVAAMQEYARAQYALALLYENGRGVKADPVEARMWLELAARGGVKEARNEITSQKLPPVQVAAARRRVAAWRPVAPPVRKDEAFVEASNAGVSAVPDPEPAESSPALSEPAIVSNTPRNAATGFFVNSEGGVLTSFALVKSCSQIVVRTAGGEKRAEMAGEDRRLGVAVIALEGGGGNALPISTNSRADGPVLQAGYQVTQHDASVITASGSVRRNGARREFRMDTPLEAPVAGGPVLNAAGQVVAVSVPDRDGSTLIWSEDLTQFLQRNRVPLGNPLDFMSAEEAGRRSVVLVECKSK